MNAVALAWAGSGADTEATTNQAALAKYSAASGVRIAATGHGNMARPVRRHAVGGSSRLAWEHWGGDRGGTRFSTLAQADGANGNGGFLHPAGTSATT